MGKDILELSTSGRIERNLKKLKEMCLDLELKAGHYICPYRNAKYQGICGRDNVRPCACRYMGSRGRIRKEVVPMVKNRQMRQGKRRPG